MRSAVSAARSVKERPDLGAHIRAVVLEPDVERVEEDRPLGLQQRVILSPVVERFAGARLARPKLTFRIVARGRHRRPAPYGRSARVVNCERSFMVPHQTTGWAIAAAGTTSRAAPAVAFEAVAQPRMR